MIAQFPPHNHHWSYFLGLNEKDTVTDTCFWTQYKFSSLSLTLSETYLLQDICSISEWQHWFDVNLFIVWKFLPWQVSPWTITPSLPCDHRLVLRMAALLCICKLQTPPPSPWRFHPSVSAPAAPAPVWKEDRHTKRPTVSACGMAHWHQPHCISRCMRWMDFYRASRQACGLRNQATLFPSSRGCFL